MVYLVFIRKPNVSSPPSTSGGKGGGDNGEGDFRMNLI